MTDKRATRADEHDIPDDERGPDTPSEIEDGESRFLPPGDKPAEGRRDINGDQNQPQDKR